MAQLLKALAWTRSSDTGSAITYKVSSSPAGARCSTSETYCQLKATAGQRYTFTVTAVSKGRNSLASAPTSTIIPGAVDCDAPDFAGRDFTGCDLSRRTLVNADFTAANLSGVKLAGADVTGASFGNIGRLLPPVATATAVSVRGISSCAITSTGTVRCWGSNAYLRADVPQDLGPVTAIAVGGSHTCAITVDGLVRCWGSNRNGQTDVPEDLGVVTAISAGEVHTCAIKVDATVECWGSQANGRSTVPDDLGTVSAISAGDRHTCAITTGATVERS
jgi:hypothetical protein